MKIVLIWFEIIFVGLFMVGFLLVSYLIFESGVLVIDSLVGWVIYMGDFKLDEIFVVGEFFDLEFWVLVSKGGL